MTPLTASFCRWSANSVWNKTINLSTNQIHTEIFYRIRLKSNGIVTIDLKEIIEHQTIEALDSANKVSITNGVVEV